MKTILLIFFISINAIGQHTWKQVNLSGGNARAVYVNGNNLLASVSDWIYFSSNSGLDWQKSSLKSIYGFNSFTSSGDSIYFASCQWGLYKSTDLVSWQHVSNREYSYLSKDKNGFLYALWDNSVYRSTDNGKNWLKYFQIDYANNSTPTLLVSGRFIYVGTLGEVYRKNIETTDPWELHQFFGYTSYSVQLASDGSGKLFGCSYYDKVLIYSSDEGSTWSNIYLGSIMSKARPVYIALKGNTVLVVNDSGEMNSKYYIYRSDDLGITWRTETNNFPQNLYVSQIFVSDNYFYAATYGAGILKSNGGTWIEINKGINELCVNNFASLDDKEIFISTYGRGALRTTDSGLNWMEVNNGINDFKIEQIIKTDQGTLFCVTEDSLYRSTDMGISWINIQMPGSYGYNKLATDGNKVFLTKDKIYVSTDNGETWQNISNFEAYDLIVDRYGFLYALTSNKLYKSSSSYILWGPLYTGPNNLNKVFADSSYIFITAWETIITSSDGGNSWNTFIFNNKSISRVFSDGNKNYFCGMWEYPNNAALMFLDGMEGTWTDITGSITASSINDMLIKKNRIFIATSSGLWVNFKDPALITVGEQDINSYFLSQNYPNPFNPSTKIKYSIACEGNVKLIIYNVLGKELGILVNEYKKAGVYELNMDGSALASGIYFYRIQAGTFTETKKMIILR